MGLQFIDIPDEVDRQYWHGVAPPDVQTSWTDVSFLC